MTSRDLYPDQLRRLRRKVERDAAYLQRLVRRMQELRFRSDDPLYHAAELARDALAQLERAAMVGAVRHGVDKSALDMSERDVRRA